MINLNAVAGDGRLQRIINQSFKGRVLNVFKNSFNIKSKKADKADIVTFIKKDNGNIPLGIILDIDSSISFYDFGLKKNMAVSFMNNEIFIADKVAVIIKNCCWYNSMIVPRILNKSLIEDNLKEVEILLKKEYLDYGLVKLVNYIENIIGSKKEIDIYLNPICKKSYKHLADFFEKLGDDEFDCAMNSLTGLIGLGCGTTPSGDDVILGIITSFYYFDCGVNLCFNNKNFRKQNFKKYKEEFKKLIYGRTTAISEKYLLQALEGNISDKLLSYMEAILGYESREALKKTTYDLMAVGASSGREIVLGTILGLKFCLDINKDEGRDLRG